MPRDPRRLRCLDIHDAAAGVWVSMCVDIDLAAQDTNRGAARSRLRAQIDDAIGAPAAKAPLRYRLAWRWLRWRDAGGRAWIHSQEARDAA